MLRHLNLRQIEVFRAVIENGTISRAAAMLNTSQPAMSKLLAHLEADTGLKLFDRKGRRLTPTKHAIRLYSEIARIFESVRQVEDIVDAIHREEQGRLALGVMTSLAGSFIRRVTADFLKDRRSIFCSIQSLGPRWTMDGLISGKLDVGLLSDPIDNPNVVVEPLLEHPLVCIMPLDHPLSAKSVIQPQDLDQMPFVAFEPDSFHGHVESVFKAYKVKVQISLVASAGLTVCEFVAAGFGVSLIHPIFASGLEHQLTVRRFEPEISHGFQLCRTAGNTNAELVEAFVQQLRATAALISHSMLEGASDWRSPSPA